MSDAATACLRRGDLIAHARAADRRAARRPRAPGVRACSRSSDELVAAVGGRGERSRRSRSSRRFDADGARERLRRRGGCSARLPPRGGYPRRCCAARRRARRALRQPGAPSALAELRDEPRRRDRRHAAAVARTASRWRTRSGAASARPGVTVVSGLALGIDAAAHRGASTAAGVPIAVLGRRRRRPLSAPPPRPLRADARARALVLSELPPGTRPSAGASRRATGSWPGSPRLTVVVEAADPSGSLITADFAQELGRDVGAVPGRVTLDVAQGTQRPAPGRAPPSITRRRGRARRAVRRRRRARLAERGAGARAGRPLLRRVLDGGRGSASRTGGDRTARDRARLGRQAAAPRSGALEAGRPTSCARRPRRLRAGGVLTRRRRAYPRAPWPPDRASRACSRSPAPTPAAAPASRPISRRSRAAACTA